MKNRFYITTTLPYVNAEPHIGFALEIIQADVLARYHRLLGEDVFFNTGTDEHGLKIYRKALEGKKDPQDYVDEYAQKYDDLKKALNLSYNSFIRTTDKRHIEAAREFWKRCVKNGDIYRDKQRIKYCVGCELEKTESELVDGGRCPLHPNKELETIEEENYFFRFSKYQKPLLKLYKEQPDFVVPENKLKEITNFVAAGLKDFSVSRLKEKLPWGVDVPGDPSQVMYVWFDALINYISAIGWPEKEKEFNQWWPGIQTAGKDNLRQQSAMWQAMLMSARLPCSKQILIHGFIASGGQKMSKSLGNVVDPFKEVERYGTDAVRYYLLREIPPTKDGDFSRQRFEELYNSDLANGLGNLLARVAKLCENNKLDFNAIDLSVFRSAGSNRVLEEIVPFLERFRFDNALEYIWKVIRGLDRYLDREKPWKRTASEAKKRLAEIIVGSEAVVSLREVVGALSPFLPETAEIIKDQFKGPKIKSRGPLFPRI